jgi:hypothetical protein
MSELREITELDCRIRRITLSDYGYRTVIFFCYQTIGISNIVLTNSRNYRAIGYRIKASIYRTIGYCNQKKLSVANLNGISRIPPPLDSAASLRPVPLVTRITQDINRGRNFCKLLPTKGEKKQRHL